MLLIQRARQKAVPRRIVPRRIMATSFSHAEPRACPIGSSAAVLISMPMRATCAAAVAVTLHTAMRPLRHRAA